MNTPPISIEALLVLDAIDYRGSYAAAAEQLNKVPSALSYIVQKQEEQLNVTLFHRQGRRSVLTPAGKYLLDEGRKLLQAINALSEQTQTVANGWEPKIRIACDSIVDIKPIFLVIQQFLNEHKDIEVDVQEEVMSGTWEALIEDHVDLVIGAPTPVPYQKGIRAIKFAELDNVLVASGCHELSRMKRVVDATDLTKFRNVVVHDSAINEIPWSVNMIEGSQQFFVSTVEQKIAAIEIGIGIGYLPMGIIKKQLKEGQLAIIELIDKPTTQQLFMAWKIANRGKGLKKLVELLSNL